MNSGIQERTILICRGTGCNSLNAGDLHKVLVDNIQKYDLKEKINIKLTGCHGFCQVGPTLIIEPDHLLYVKLTESDVENIVKEHLIGNKVVEKHLYKDPNTNKSIFNLSEIPFYKEQTPVITEFCGKINPEDIREYLSQGGYNSLKKVLSELNPLNVIELIKKSGLRGRGGAGFSTAQKWSFCRDAEGSPKYIICNGDEGDPGAFMDRTLLESDPHSVIEGMIIAAFAIGARYGYIYIRAEYPLAIERFNVALEQARECNFLGIKILGTSFDFDIILKKGAGAFVCGEETALMASIMGKRGMPRPRPPYPAVSGLWNKPTNINNVKTYCFIPRIIDKGAEWFSSIGTKDASGTMVIALTGKINNSGLVEIPMGTTIRKLIDIIGGGIPNNKKFKAVQTGGPSGGCIPEKFIDTPLDYLNLTSLGSIMGSGGFIVLDEDTCMVDLAHYFISFTQKESCGKCAPCRIGTKKMLDLLTKIKDGKAVIEDLEKLETLADLVKKTSLCGLGQTAPNPVLTTIKYFRNEYKEHIIKKSCPALICKHLISYSIDEGLCNGCGACLKSCPSNAIKGEQKKVHIISSELCIRCGLCYSLCPNNAIIKTTSLSKIGESK